MINVNGNFIYTYSKMYIFKIILVLEEVDFVIIGCGAAGSVLANRLSEISRWKILVLEAGGFENAFTDIPGMNGYIRSGVYNWGYKTVPQTVGCKGNKIILYSASASVVS